MVKEIPVLGTKSVFKGSACFHAPTASFVIGDYSYIAEGCVFHIEDQIVIGNYVMVSWMCLFIDTNMHSLDAERRKQELKTILDGKPKNWTGIVGKPIIIEDLVWIGTRSMILRGVRVGEGSVISAGSVVTSNIPPYSLVRGNPAEVVRKLK